MTIAERLYKTTVEGLMEPFMTQYELLMLAAQNKYKYCHDKRGQKIFGFSDGSSLCFDGHSKSVTVVSK